MFRGPPEALQFWLPGRPNARIEPGAPDVALTSGSFFIFTGFFTLGTDVGNSILTSEFHRRIISDMRTTLSIDDDIFHLVKRYAASRSLALGKAVSELVRRALTTPRPTRSVNGLQVFDLPPQSPKVSSKKVRALDADQQ